MSVVRFLVAILALLMTGAAVLTLAVPRPRTLRWSEIVGVSWLLGTGFLAWTAHLGLLFFAGTPGWLWWSILAPPTLVLGTRRWERWRLGPDHVRPAPPSSPLGRTLTIALAALIVIQVLSVVLGSQARALEGDGMVLWALKAKAMYLDATIRPGSVAEYFSETTWNFSNLDYPVGFSAVEAWVFLTSGGVVERPIALLGPLYFSALLAILVARLRDFLSAPEALLLGALCASVPGLGYFAQLSCADVPLAALLLAAAAYGASALARDDTLLEWLTVLLVATLPLFKKEGAILTVVCVATYLAAGIPARPLGRILRPAGRFAVGVSCISGPWFAFRVLAGLHGKDFLPLTAGVLWDNRGRARTILRYLGALFVRYEDFAWTWPVLALVALLRGVRWPAPEVRFPAALFTASLGAYAMVFMFSAWQPFQQHMDVAFDRLLSQLTPVAILCAGHLLRPLPATRLT